MSKQRLGWIFMTLGLGMEVLVFFLIKSGRFAELPLQSIFTIIIGLLLLYVGGSYILNRVPYGSMGYPAESWGMTFKQADKMLDQQLGRKVKKGKRPTKKSKKKR